MLTEMLNENVPSDMKENLELIPGRTLERLVRYSWSPLKKAVTEYNLREEDVFSLTAGPVLLYFDSGLVIGAASNPGKNSVVLWVEKNEAGEVVANPLEDDHELYPIDAKNSSKTWSSLVGNKVDSIRGIYRKPNSVKMQKLPNEVGLVFVLESGDQFILSHGLHDNSDDFSVITIDQISKNLVSELTDIIY